MKGEQVYVVLDPQQGATDRYGRTLAYVYRARDGLFVNAEIIRQGYGRAYTVYPFRYMEEFRQLEKLSREAERGLWGLGEAQVQEMNSDNPIISYLIGARRTGNPMLDFMQAMQTPPEKTETGAYQLTPYEAQQLREQETKDLIDMVIYAKQRMALYDLPEATLEEKASLPPGKITTFNKKTGQKETEYISPITGKMYTGTEAIRAGSEGQTLPGQEAIDILQDFSRVRSNDLTPDADLF